MRLETDKVRVLKMWQTWQLGSLWQMRTMGRM
jgi:hypothetical protein